MVNCGVVVALDPTSTSKGSEPCGTYRGEEQGVGPRPAWGATSQQRLPKQCMYVCNTGGACWERSGGGRALVISNKNPRRSMGIGGGAIWVWGGERGVLSRCPRVSVSIHTFHAKKMGNRLPRRVFLTS